MRLLSVVVAAGAAGLLACAEPPPAPRSTLARQSGAGQPRAKRPGATITDEKAPPRADVSLIRRRVLFTNEDRLAPKLSPDGRRLAFLAERDGAWNVWVSEVNDLAAAKPVTSDRKRGIGWYTWAYTNEHILFLQDEGGDENWHLHAVDLRTGDARDLTPMPGIAARLVGVSWKKPMRLVVALNDRDKRWHDLHEVDLATGAHTMVQKNEGFSAYDLDLDLKVRLAQKPMKDGSVDVQEPDGKGGFRSVFTIPFEDRLTTRIVGFDGSGTKVHLVDSRGRDTAAFVEMDLTRKTSRVVLEDPQADIESLVVSPRDRKPQAAIANYLRHRWHVADPTIRGDLDVLEAASPGDIDVVSRSLDDTRWLVSYATSDAPTKYALYDRSKPEAKKVTVLSKATVLDRVKLAPMMPVVIPARDGLSLVSYLTLPAGSVRPNGDARPERPLPMVLRVHGGPWMRGEWRFDRHAQWLANRGYAVLDVNYRGSRGFGKRFLEAGDHEWGGKMQEDLLEAAGWATTQGIADPRKVAIMGGSYGGYAALVGLTFTPDTFACGVDIAGPSNLETFLRNVPPYWESEAELFAKRVGDIRTEEGRKLLADRSPLGRVDRIKKPLLIGQGTNDPRVKQAESDRIVAAMQSRRLPVTYVLYPDEGHGIERPENHLSFHAVAEVFLAQCLDGPYEPIGKDFAGASISVPAGKEHVDGLAAALDAAAKR